MVSVSNLDEHDGKKLSDGIMVNPKKPKKKKKPPQKNRKVSFRVQPTTDEESDHDKETNDNKVNVLVNGNAIEERKGEEEREITRVVENAKMFPEVSSAGKTFCMINYSKSQNIFEKFLRLLFLAPPT